MAVLAREKLKRLDSKEVRLVVLPDRHSLLLMEGGRLIETNLRSGSLMTLTESSQTID